MLALSVPSHDEVLVVMTDKNMLIAIDYAVPVSAVEVAVNVDTEIQFTRLRIILHDSVHDLAILAVAEEAFLLPMVLGLLMNVALEHSVFGGKQRFARHIRRSGHDAT